MDYYIDLNAVSKFVTVVPDGEKIREKETISNGTAETITVKEYDKQLEIDTTKYNMVNTMIEVLFNQDPGDLDFSMGIDKALENAPTGFRIAFNTLESFGLIKEFE